MASWIKDAVFYEIYPNSFMDADGDGYGDFKGIISKLDYVADLGCDAIWLNPCFDSPFMDGGYDVRDFIKVSPRYGTAEDFDRLVKECKKRGIRLLLDLVAGHTSEENEMFLKSARPERNEFTDRFVWTKGPFDMPAGYRLISGRHQRYGAYLVNFFSTQPALNYGFNRIEYPEWQMHYTHPECLKTREWLKGVMRYWLKKGVDGFRVDMAASLIKNDEDCDAVVELWRDIKEMLNREFPEAALVSEWAGPRATDAGFDVDFMLDHPDKPYNYLLRYERTGANNHSVFDKKGRGNPELFFTSFRKWHDKIKGRGYAGIITCNHDTPRLTVYYDKEQLKIIYATLLALPGVPFIYYGDEVGMRYQGELPSKECGYERTGSRTPMQWTGGKNAGFSDASATRLFLPVDTRDKTANVEAQNSDPDSLLNVTRRAVRMRKKYTADLASDDFEAVYMKPKSFPFIFRRGGLTVVVNPTDEEKTAPVEVAGKAVFNVRGAASAGAGKTVAPPLSFTLFKSGK